MRALVYSASRKGSPAYGDVGDRRWECEWYELTTAAKARAAADPDYEFDHDTDFACRVTVHGSKGLAVAAARKVAPSAAYGYAVVQEHVLDWMVEEDRVAEWEPVGPQFEVDHNGEVAEV